MSPAFTEFLPVVSAQDEPGKRAFLHEAEAPRREGRENVVVPWIGLTVEAVLGEDEPDAPVAS